MLAVPAFGGLRQQAHVSHHRDACGDDGAYLRHQRTLQLDGVRAGVDEHLCAGHGLRRCRVGVGGQIAADVRSCGAIGHRPHVVRHHLQRHRTRGVVAQFHLAHAVAHEDDVEPHLIQRQCHGVVVGREHGQATTALERADVGGGEDQSTSHMTGTMSSTNSVTSLREFTCTTVGS